MGNTVFSEHLISALSKRLELIERNESNILIKWIELHLESGKHLPIKECLENDTKLHLMVKLQFLKSWECEITFHC